MVETPLVLAQEAEAAGSFIFLLVWLAIVVFFIVSMWRVFEKAGEPGWAALIPIYNGVVICRVGGKPGWWVILMFIPVVSIVIWILVCLGIAECFGQGAGFAIGLFFLGFIFFPILAFGNYEWAPAA